MHNSFMGSVQAGKVRNAHEPGLEVVSLARLRQQGNRTACSTFRLPSALPHGVHVHTYGVQAQPPTAGPEDGIRRNGPAVLPLTVGAW